MTTITELTQLVLNQVKHEQLTDNKGIDKVYSALYTDAAKFGFSDFEMFSFTDIKSRAFISKAIAVKQGRFFQYYQLPNKQVIIANKY